MAFVFVSIVGTIFVSTAIAARDPLLVQRLEAVFDPREHREDHHNLD